MSVIVATGAGIAAMWIVWTGQRPFAGQRTGIHGSATETTLSAIWEGAETADIVLIEFSDFQCRYCAIFAVDTYPAIQKQFVQTGRVRYVVGHLPSGASEFSIEAARVGTCAAAQDRYWEMRRLLFADQSSRDRASLLQHAHGLALDASAFSDCMTDQKTSALVAADVAEAERLGIFATPTFLLGRLRADRTTVMLSGTLQGTQSFEAFEAAIGSMR